MSTAISSLGYDDYFKSVSRHLGFTSVATDLSADEADIVNGLVQDGLRRFYSEHSWDFLNPSESLILWADVALDSSVTVSGGAFADSVTPVTASAASFHPLMVGKSIVITTVGTFVIASYTSTTVVNVTGDANTASADTFSISGAGDYQLDPEFASIEGRLTFDTEAFTLALQKTSESEIRALRQTGVTAGIPQKYGERIIESDGTTDHLIEILTWPIPNKDYTVTSRFNIHPTLLSSAEPKALGGPAYSRTVLLACMAEAELFHDDMETGPHDRRYQEALRNSIVRDQKEHAPELIGRNDDRSDGARLLVGSTHIVTVNGVTPT